MPNNAPFLSNLLASTVQEYHNYFNELLLDTSNGQHSETIIYCVTRINQFSQ